MAGRGGCYNRAVPAPPGPLADTHHPGAPAADAEVNLYEDVDAVWPTGGRGSGGGAEGKVRGLASQWGGGQEYESLAAVAEAREPDKTEYMRLDSSQRSGEGWGGLEGVVEKAKGERPRLCAGVCLGVVLGVCLCISLPGWILYGRARAQLARKSRYDVCSVGPYGSTSNASQRFSDLAFSRDGSITGVEIWTVRGVMNSLRVRYGESWGPRRGAATTGSEELSAFYFSMGENVTSVKGRYSIISVWNEMAVTSLQLISTKTYYFPVGRAPSSSEQFIASGPRLLYISGNQGDALYSLTLHYSCCLDWTGNYQLQGA